MSVTKNPGRNILGTNGTTDWGSVGVKKTKFLVQIVEKFTSKCATNAKTLPETQRTQGIDSRTWVKGRPEKVFVFFFGFCANRSKDFYCHHNDHCHHPDMRCSTFSSDNTLPIWWQSALFTIPVSRWWYKDIWWWLWWSFVIAVSFIIMMRT